MIPSGSSSRMNPQPNPTEAQPKQSTSSVSRFGWKQRTEIPPSSPPASTSSTSSQVYRGTGVQTPVRNRMSTNSKTSTGAYLHQKRDSKEGFESKMLSPNSKALQYIPKRDKIVSSYPPSSSTEGTRLAARQQSPTVSMGARPRSPSTPSRNPPHSTPVASPNRMISRDISSPNHSHLTSRPTISPSPSSTPHRPSARPNSVAPRFVNPKALTPLEPPRPSLVATIPEVEVPLFSPNMQEQLNSNAIVELTEQPSMDAFDRFLGELDSIELTCTTESVIKLRKPNQREQIEELEVILENLRRVFRDLLQRRNTLVEEVDQVERAFLQYTTCVHHNRVIKETTKGDLEERNERLVEKIGKLNSTSLQLSKQIDELDQEVGERWEVNENDVVTWNIDNTTNSFSVFIICR